MIYKKTLTLSILIVEDNEIDFVLVESYLANEAMPVIVRKENNLLLINNYDKR